MRKSTSDEPAAGSSRFAGLNRPWSQDVDAVVAFFDVDPGTGLSDTEARRRLREHGPNRLREIQGRSPWLVFLTQFKSLIVVLLAGAAILSFSFHEWLDGSAVLVVLLVNAIIGFLMEMRAEKSVQALRRLGRTLANVRRDGVLHRVSAEELVPGDIVVFEGGDVVSADIRLLTASRLQADESALTGESVPVVKRPLALAADTPLAERFNMLYKGTALTRGSAEGMVVATGMDTELGRISALVETAEQQATPLEERLDRLGRNLIWITLAIAVVTALMGIRSGKGILLMIETGIALAVAAIPEGLPIVATIALAKGMHRMARNNALVNRLSSVETLGATGVICTDKTGTLTENRMTVRYYALTTGDVDLLPPEEDGTAARTGEPAVLTSDNPGLRRALEIGILCNNASLGSTTSASASPVGDPLEVALLQAGEQAGISPEELRTLFPEEREEAFDSDLKMMASYHRTDEGLRVVVKGAAEPVLQACTTRVAPEGVAPLNESDTSHWLQRNEELANEGFRVLALAEKHTDDLREAPYQGLSFVGLVGLVDPPRADVPEALRQCHDAGIQVVMITGDQPATARYVARAVGLIAADDDSPVLQGTDFPDAETIPPAEAERFRRARLFARVTPKQKLQLVSAHQEHGTVVAMTGDGVNDAPALKKADIGIAMGLRGTDVAREAADMVLTDDAFATIVAAVEQGRIIFANIRRFVMFLMSCNLSEILVVGLASSLSRELPILPLQILFLNIVTDVFPALALGVGEGDPAVMEDSPRDPGEPILGRREWGAVFGYGICIAACVLAGFVLARTWLGAAEMRRTSIAFLILAFAQLWHVFNMRGEGSHVWRNDVVRNPFVWAALGICAAMLIGAVYLPGISTALKLVDPGFRGWALIAGLSLMPCLLGQAVKMIRGMLASRGEGGSA